MPKATWMVLGWLLSIALTSSCSSRVPPAVTMGPPTQLSRDAKIFVQAPRQMERIVQSLRDAGFETITEWSGNDYSLQVKVGSNRTSQACGAVNNVAYVLWGQNQRLMAIKGRGPTGSCADNIFDDLSRELAAHRGPN